MAHNRVIVCHREHIYAVFVYRNASDREFYLQIYIIYAVIEMNRCVSEGKSLYTLTLIELDELDGLDELIGLRKEI